MKNSIAILSLFLLSLSSFAENDQSVRGWSIGLQLAATGNHSVYSGGMLDANALFTNNVYGTGMLGIYGRYRVCNRLSFQSGYDFSQIGFNYALAQDYSLLKPKDHYLNLQSGTGLTRIPMIALYNSNLNCRNFRYVVGVGLAANFVDNKWKSETSSTVQSENGTSTSTASMSVQSRTVNSTTGSFTWLVGSEKVFKNGSLLSLTLQWNHGFSPVAESTVQYTVDNKEYSHTFLNRASYFNLALSYYFKQFGSKKIGLPIKSGAQQAN